MDIIGKEELNYRWWAVPKPCWTCQLDRRTTFLQGWTRLDPPTPEEHTQTHSTHTGLSSPGLTTLWLRVQGHNNSPKTGRQGDKTDKKTLAVVLHQDWRGGAADPTRLEWRGEGTWRKGPTIHSRQQRPRRYRYHLSSHGLGTVLLLSTVSGVLREVSFEYTPAVPS